jgi:hypothetical protein
MTDPVITPVDTPVTNIQAPTDLTGAALAEAGATPIIPDVTALMDQMAAMQKRLDAMSAAAGVPSDPIAAAVKDVSDHITARATANPSLKDSFAEMVDTIKNLPDPPTAQDTDLLRTVIDDFVGGYVEGLEYIRSLANRLHKMVLKG